MKLFPIITALFLYSVITGCSNLTQVNLANDNNHYGEKRFTHYEFSANHNGSVKKAASSDHQLMLSLLNRPMPEDQRMMLEFANNQQNYLPDSALVGTHIKGDKKEDHTHNRNRSQYAYVIEQDNNAIVINDIAQ